LWLLLAGRNDPASAFNARFVPFKDVQQGKLSGEEYSLDTVVYRSGAVPAAHIRFSLALGLCAEQLKMHAAFSSSSSTDAASAGSKQLSARGRVGVAAATAMHGHQQQRQCCALVVALPLLPLPLQAAWLRDFVIMFH
jgi:hypothetical protein